MYNVSHPPSLQTPFKVYKIRFEISPIIYFFLLYETHDTLNIFLYIIVSVSCFLFSVFCFVCLCEYVQVRIQMRGLVFFVCR